MVAVFLSARRLSLIALAVALRWSPLETPVSLDIAPMT